MRQSAGGFALQERDEAAALHLLWPVDAREFEQCRRNVDVERHAVVDLAATILRGTRIEDDERHANRVLVDVPLVRETALAEEVAIIRGKDDDRVIGQSVPFECRADAAHDEINARDHAVIARDHFLILLRLIEAPVEADAALGLAKECRQ